MNHWKPAHRPAAWCPRLDGPARALLVGLALCAGLACLPQQWSNGLKDSAALVCEPGCRASVRLQAAVRDVGRSIRAQFATADQLLAARQEIERLEQQNARLRRELAALRTAVANRPNMETPHSHATASDGKPWDGSTSESLESLQPLLRAKTIPANVLGAQARTFLARRRLLDVGALEGVEPDALVLDQPALLDPPVLLDQGDDARLSPGQLVLCGAAVWGRIVEVGRHVSTVCPVTEQGFRDVVQLVDPQSGGRLGPHCPQGLLEGTGQPLARIRSIEVTEPVAVGDLVFSASVSGLVETPLLYGRVVRVERPAGASSWEIWMEPAVPARGVEQVRVLCAEVNPLRLAERGPGLRVPGVRNHQRPKAER